jgi:competence ComEA-like helix-hairpin-helix protein
MQQKTVFCKSHYFNNWLSLAKLLSLLIIVYCAVFCISCAKAPPATIETAQNQPETSESAININTATVAELEKLPRIGKEFAGRIIDHREKYGAFRRPEDLLLVRGISDKKFREIRSLVKTE